VDAKTMRRRLEAARVARLATAGADARPHLVPIVFTLDGERIYFAVDSKPKRTRDLRRLANIAANPRVSVLVDHYDDDWTRLWWVRADGAAHLVTEAADADRALDLLARKYPQYRQARPPGPVIVIAVDRMTGWEAAANPAC
jgi:PPOX class probable F420-dependent enzyme